MSIHAGMLACSAFDRSISIYLLTLETNHVLTDRRIGNSPRLRIAASSYLNSAPLIWSFLHGSMRGRIDFIEAVPARCADLLSQSQVEAALVPVIEYQRIPAGLLVPDVCVGSKKEVRSVVLVSRHAELHQIRSVALDESSRTSATLVKVIFREFLEHEPTWTTHSPNLQEMLEQNDAALIIGDPGMVFPRTGLKVWDMAQLWRNYTRLGFVFAMWMVRDEAIQDARHIDFAAACNEGLGMKDQIIAQYEKLLGLSRQSLKEYLDENICFRLDDELQSGLELYFQLAHKHGLLSELKPLKTLKP
ncbi:MAG TPA: menaquinone biosynthesis protein [Pyrinomonadaceae bacterium]|nr:menaquinone biosynthesis protein [Pyrinomonadaceae bacterium]